MNTEEKIACLESLKSLRDRGPVRVSQGVCYNSYGLPCCDLARKWPKHSGNYFHPIPAPWYYKLLGLDSQGYYNGCSNKWKGRQGKLRMELLQFLIEQLEHELGEAA